MMHGAPQPRDPATPARAGMACMKLHQVVEWTPQWSEHRFVLLGAAEWAQQMASHYDKGTNEGNTSTVVAQGNFDLLVDVGAAYGYYTCLLKARHPDIPVVAIEADPLRYGCLLKNCSPYVDVEAVYGMAGNYALCLPLAAGMCDVRGRGRPLVTQQFSLADLWALRPDAKEPLFKIDTEGGESQILTGCEELIANKNTRWIVEHHAWDPGATLDQLVDMFRSCGREPVVREPGSSSVNHIHVD